MTLIKSISGIRGTLENIPGESLSDFDVRQFTLAYHQEIISNYENQIVVANQRMENLVNSLIYEKIELGKLRS